MHLFESVLADDRKFRTKMVNNLNIWLYVLNLIVKKVETVHELYCNRMGVSEQDSDSIDTKTNN